MEQQFVNVMVHEIFNRPRIHFNVILYFVNIQNKGLDTQAVIYVDGPVSDLMS